ncbi:hypothetical protein LJB91_01620 [Bacteroidales bacterium OttesenSCG-928-L03]|nr:hypothetical protein [Bacteroidales bacterium OttesenSCG-928-L03]
MKTTKYIALLILCMTGLFSCENDWDSHYSKQEPEINSDNIEIVDMNINEYLKSVSEYSSMTELLEYAKVFKDMDAQGLYYTVFVIPNGSFTTPDSESDKIYTAQGHVTTASFAPSALKNGQRILMWNKKYVDVGLPTEGGDLENITFNVESRIEKVIKTNNGYIYVLDKAINMPKSLLELIEGLDDDKYSIFKEMVLSKNERVFDRENSTPIGVDNSGNTLYDSVFVVKNPYFLAKKFDLASESMKATLLIPSNELITNAVTEAKEKAAAWRIQRQDSIFWNWCFQVAFFNQEYKREDFENNIDLPIGYANGQNLSHSVFGKQWRTTVNKVDLDNPIQMSNGTAYYMTELRIPTNVIIYRIKGWMCSKESVTSSPKSYYNTLTPEDKEKYFAFENVDESTVRIQTYTTWKKEQPWTAFPGNPAFPPIFHGCLEFKLTSYDNNYNCPANGLVNRAVWEFTPVYFQQYEDGSYDIEPVLLPPGEYNYHFGLAAGAKYNYEVYLNDWLQVSKLSDTDRNNLGGVSGHRLDIDSGEGPEFVPDASLRYDRDGRKIGTAFTITGEPTEMRVKMVLTRVNASYISLMHWCFKPTANCY